MLSHGCVSGVYWNLFNGEAARAMGTGVYGIRPEHVLLSPERGRWQGRVRHVERLGADAIVYLDVPQLGELVARTGGDTTLGPGAQVWASPQDGAEHRFGA